MKYTIAINSYRNPEMLARCLRYACQVAEMCDGEVIVADSHTQEETITMMREDFPQVRFFPYEKNVGMGALANKGLQEARGTYVFLINYDCVIDETSVKSLGEYLDSHEEVGIIAPKILNFDGTLQYTCCRYYHPVTILYRRTPLGNFSFAKKHLDRFIMKDVDHDTIIEPDWVMGSAMMVRKEEALSLGGFDARFFMYFEDTDLCRRYWESGKKVTYLPQAHVYHLHGKGSARGGLIRSLLCNKLTWIHIASACKYFWKYRGKSYTRE